MYVTDDHGLSSDAEYHGEPDPPYLALVFHIVPGA